MEITENTLFNEITIQLEKDINHLKRHIQIYKLIKQHEPIGISGLFRITHIPASRVRYSMKILETHNMIKLMANGAVIVPLSDDPLHLLQPLIKKLRDELESISNFLE